MTVTERRAQEVARQKKRNRRDLFQCIFYITALIAWAMVLVGFADIVAGGW
jgi:predicted nucleic acid-binding Zn ribbon protein